MPPDLLNRGIVKMTSVAEEARADVVRVLQAAEDLLDQWNLAALTKLQTFTFARTVHLLNPTVVLIGQGVGDVVLELDDVLVWDSLGVDRREDGSGIAMDGFVTEGRCRRRVSRQREGDEAAHVGYVAKNRGRSASDLEERKEVGRLAVKY